MKQLLILEIFLFASLISSAQFCNDDNRFTEFDYFEISELDSTSNATYGYAVDWLGNQDTLILDVFFPDNSIDPMALRPAVMMMHGGGFQGGSKESRQTECIALARRGYVAFNINYRVGWDTNDSVNQVYAAYRANQDARAAMRFIVENKDFYRVDTNWLFVAGSSAGAINAIHLAYSQQDEWNTSLPGVEQLLGNLNTSSNNLTHTYTIKGIFNNWGSCFPGILDESELLPTISFHGDQDPTVNIDSSSFGSLGSRVLHNISVNNNICSDLSVVPGGDHGVYTGPSGAYFRASKASCFFKSIFCNYCTTVYTTDSIAANCSEFASLQENEGMNKVVAYPNTFGKEVQLNNVSTGATISIYNLEGKIVFEKKYDGLLDLEYLDSGIYLLNISDGDSHNTIRIVKH